MNRLSARAAGAAAFCLLALASWSCNKSPAAPSGGPILVFGSDMGPLYQNIDVSRDGTPTSGAQVRVNGTLIPETSTGFYSGQLPATLDPGATITVEVTVGSDVVTGTATIPTAPVVVTPTPGTSVHPGTPTTFTWTDALNPDEFFLSVGYHSGGGGSSKSTTVSGTLRSGSVDTTGIPGTATNLSAELFAYANGTFTGPADSTSKMHVRQEAPGVPLVLTSPAPVR